MADRERETVRRVLEALLAKLDGESLDSDARESSIVSDSIDRASPVIVVLDGLNSKVQEKDDRCRPRPNELGGVASANGSAPVREAHQASHPGLERFPLAETQSQSSVPRACFMEPGRTCVSSGACEMRGY
jgi:hypothetical protein